MSNTTFKDAEKAEAAIDKYSSQLKHKHERIIIACLCLFAALRIFIFSAAFPPFANTDEPLHFDLVYKYALGHIPTGLEHPTNQAQKIELLYSSPEYIHSPGEYPEGKYPPPRWSQPKEEREFKLNRALEASKDDINMESTQPPVYYSLAAGWLKLGITLGIKEGGLVYWLRFMNTWLVALLVLLAYTFARKIRPDNIFFRLGIPVTLAFLPQDIFYSINNDVLSPLVTGLALYCLLEICLSQDKNVRFYLFAGLLTAAAFLVKFSNVAILAALGFTAIYRIYISRRQALTRRELVKCGAMVLAAALPVGLWLLRNYLVLGDITGSAAKTQYLGWQTKYFDELQDHPLFSFSGLITFFNDLLASLWRGEFLWHSEPLASRGCDLFYSISSGLFVVLSGAAAFGRRAVSKERLTGIVSLGMLVISILFLATVSVSYDFGYCFYPSRNYPYITSGRLISGILIPFLALWIGGLDLLLKKLRLQKFRFAILAIICIILTSSEIMLSRSAFGSAYNWFHLK